MTLYYRTVFVEVAQAVDVPSGTEELDVRVPTCKFYDEKG
jgi:hypothetical protein